MTEPILRELVEAARPFVPPLQAAGPYHVGDPHRLTDCAYCIRVLRFRAALLAAERTIA